MSILTSMTVHQQKQEEIARRIALWETEESKKRPLSDNWWQEPGYGSVDYVTPSGMPILLQPTPGIGKVVPHMTRPKKEYTSMNDAELKIQMITIPCEDQPKGPQTISATELKTMKDLLDKESQIAPEQYVFDIACEDTFDQYTYNNWIPAYIGVAEGEKQPLPEKEEQEWFEEESQGFLGFHAPWTNDTKSEKDITLAYKSNGAPCVIPTPQHSSVLHQLTVTCNARKKNIKGKHVAHKGRNGNFSPRVSSFARFKVPIVPSRLDTRLRSTFIFTLTGGTTVTRRYNPNSAYTPEVGGATGTTPGYSELAALYGFYRVMGHQYKAICTNLEAFPVSIVAINSNNDPTTSAGVVQANNDLCTTKVLSSKGGMDRATLSGRFTVARILGSRSVEQADTYRSLINGNPADVTWLGLGAQSGTGTSLTLGVVVVLELVQFVSFYDRLLQT